MPSQLGLVLALQCPLANHSLAASLWDCALLSALLAPVSFIEWGHLEPFVAWSFCLPFFLRRLVPGELPFWVCVALVFGGVGSTAPCLDASSPARVGGASIFRG